MSGARCKPFQLAHRQLCGSLTDRYASGIAAAFGVLLSGSAAQPTRCWTHPPAGLFSEHSSLHVRPAFPLPLASHPQLPVQLAVGEDALAARPHAL